jgi:hypothetical protein
MNRVGHLANSGCQYTPESYLALSRTAVRVPIALEIRDQRRAEMA